MKKTVFVSFCTTRPLWAADKESVAIGRMLVPATRSAESPATLPKDTVERIGVLKSSSSLYGAEAMGGGNIILAISSRAMLMVSLVMLTAFTVQLQLISPITMVAVIIVAYSVMMLVELPFSGITALFGVSVKIGLLMKKVKL